MTGYSPVPAPRAQVTGYTPPRRPRLVPVVVTVGAALAVNVALLVWAVTL